MDRVQTISERTLIPISLMTAALGFIIGATYWAASLHSRVASAEESVSDVKGTQKELIKELKTVNENLIEIRTVLKQKEN